MGDFLLEEEIIKKRKRNIEEYHNRPKNTFPKDYDAFVAFIGLIFGVSEEGIVLTLETNTSTA